MVQLTKCKTQKIVISANKVEKLTQIIALIYKNNPKMAKVSDIIIKKAQIQANLVMLYKHIHVLGCMCLYNMTHSVHSVFPVYWKCNGYIMHYTYQCMCAILYILL